MGKMKHQMMESSDEEFNTYLSSSRKRKLSVKSVPAKRALRKRKMNSGSLSVGRRKPSARSLSVKSSLRKQNRNAGRSRADVPKVPFGFGDVGPTENGDLKIWDPCFQPNDYWTATVYISSDIAALRKIKRNLNDTQLNMFRATCFGRFLDLSEIKVQPQLIHCLLMRELYQPDSSCVFIEVGGERLRFGRDEFSMICGLKCLENKVVHNSQGRRLIQKYFPKTKHIYCADIARVFEDRKWETDEDAVKLSLMYFIHVFLLGTPDNKFVADTDFDLVETGEYSEYFWGTHVFDLTMRSLKKNAQNQSRPGFYRMYGCPVLFQIWFYEVCGFARGFLCERTDSGIPRMFNWGTLSAAFNREILERILFSKSPEQLNCKNMVPDEEANFLEIYHMWMVPFEAAEDVPTDEDASMNKDNNTSFERPDRPPQHSSGRNEGDRPSERSSEGSKLLKEVAALRTYMESSFEKVFQILAEMNKRFDEMNRAKRSAEDVGCKNALGERPALEGSTCASAVVDDAEARMST